ncbi:hypothetical protein LTR37_020790 [Vermiconidia calcicola]|uniref:Uncharacterized protein n=1 Tax=Vermiconidia calcicola TaxID=1690605 RepID=A0ACC3MAA4_9PEZI|nr:hypothetical protein LTR37_020790 [Vermiconidia calcicola]
MDINMLLNPVDDPVEEEYTQTPKSTPTVLGVLEVPTPRRQHVDDHSANPKRNADAAPDHDDRHSDSIVGDVTLTDDEILRGSLAQLHGARLIQVAKTRRNKEIMNIVNSYYAEPVLNTQSIHSRLYRAVAHVAQQQGRWRDDVKRELDAARATNGVFIRQLAEGSERSLSIECDELLKGDQSLLIHERLLKVATMNTRTEIVEKVNSIQGGLAGRVISEAVVTKRLTRVYRSVAHRNGILPERVKKELARARERKGVAKRQTMQISASLRAFQAAKRAQAGKKTDSGQNAQARLERRTSDDTTEKTDFFETSKSAPTSSNSLCRFSFSFVVCQD